MGGTLTNHETVSTSLAKYKKFLRMEDDGSLDKLPGKESAAIRRQMSRMHRNFEGLLNLQGLPSALFVIDSHNESIAIAEANRLKIPVIALVDSNSDPSLLTHPIPGNDDSTKSIRIIVGVILDAIQSGASRRVETPTRRKDITPIAQEPDFVDQEDEPEVTLPEGYEESDFDERKKSSDPESEEEATAEPDAVEEVQSTVETEAEEERTRCRRSRRDALGNPKRKHGGRYPGRRPRQGLMGLTFLPPNTQFLLKNVRDIQRQRA